jgi:hypothetical protein
MRRQHPLRAKTGIPLHSRPKRSGREPIFDCRIRTAEQGRVPSRAERAWDIRWEPLESGAGEGEIARKATPPSDEGWRMTGQFPAAHMTGNDVALLFGPERGSIKRSIAPLGAPASLLASVLPEKL